MVQTEAEVGNGKWWIAEPATHRGSYGRFECAGDAGRDVITERSRA